MKRSSDRNAHRVLILALGVLILGGGVVYVLWPFDMHRQDRASPNDVRTLPSSCANPPATDTYPRHGCSPTKWCKPDPRRSEASLNWTCDTGTLDHRLEYAYPHHKDRAHLHTAARPNGQSPSHGRRRLVQSYPHHSPNTADRPAALSDISPPGCW